MCGALCSPSPGLPALPEILCWDNACVIHRFLSVFFPCKNEAFSLWRDVFLAQFLWKQHTACVLSGTSPVISLPALDLPQFVTKAGYLLWVDLKTHFKPTPYTPPHRRAWSRLVWSPPKVIVLKLSAVAAGSWPCFPLDVKETIDFQEGKLSPAPPKEVREREYQEKSEQTVMWATAQQS